jgi:glycosyltransferase involved in cell wall biosynthesis
MRIAICNNMVTPYTNRLLNHMVERHALDLTVISCTAREKNRNWSKQYAARYKHVILRGIEFDLPGSRSAHINVGMWRTLRRLSPDIVAINGIYPTMLVAALWSHVNRRPLVFLTDGWADTMPQSVFHRVMRPTVIGHSQAVICSSEKGRQFFLQQGVEPTKIFISSLVPAWSGPSSTPGFDQRRYNLLWCARIHDTKKNWPFFVDVVLELKRRHAGITVRIVADSAAVPPELERLAAAKVAVEYTPHVAPQEMSSVFLNARVLALPSKPEPWGLVCNESMQCGTPCVVSPFTGVAGELVVDEATGLVRQLDVDQWAAAISRLITDEAYWRTTSEAAMRIASQYTLDRSASKYMEALMSTQRPHSPVLSRVEAVRVNCRSKHSPFTDGVAQ